MGGDGYICYRQIQTAVHSYEWMERRWLWKSGELYGWLEMTIDGCKQLMITMDGWRWVDMAEDSWRCIWIAKDGNVCGYGWMEMTKDSYGWLDKGYV